MKKFIVWAIAIALVACVYCAFVACTPSVEPNDPTEDNTKAAEVVFRVVDDAVQWKYDFEGDDMWRNVPVGGGAAEESVYEQYKKAHPDYTGDEQQWLDDLLNDRLMFTLKFTVGFDSVGGSDVNAQVVKFGGVVTLPPSPQKTGHEFVCWQLDGEEWDFSTPVLQKMTLTAKWSPKTYKINYLVDDGTNSADNPTEYTYGTTVQLHAAERESYKFVGWRILDEDGEKGDIVTEISPDRYGDVTVVAEWQPLMLKYRLKDDGTYAVAGVYREQIVVVIPSEYEGRKVTSVDEKALMFQNQMLSVTLPETLTEICDMAFFGCVRLVEVINLSPDINLGGGQSMSANGWLTSCALSVKTSGTTDLFADGDFWYLPKDDKTYLVCYQGSDKKVIMPELEGKNVAINTNAFYYDDNIEQIVLSANVTELSTKCFAECTNLNTLVVGKSLAQVGEYVFNISSVMITAPLKVFYNGTENDWSQVNVDWLENDNKTVYYFSEQQPSDEGNYWHYDANGEAVAW